MKAARRFRPREGALLDLESLDALSEAAPAALRATLLSRWPSVTALVLEGLELQGAWSTSGPPGTVRPDPAAGGVVISAGQALVRDSDGVAHFVDVKEPLRAEWPTRAGVAVSGTLVLMPVIKAETGASGLAVARDALQVRLGFVPRERDDLPHLLPLATAVGNGRDWATDLRRLLQPYHPAVRALARRIDDLEQTVWNAEPEGAVWERQVLGRNWVRYQTMAASALQAARLQLAVHPLTTGERVRLLSALFIQLRRSVERAATELAQVIGPPDEAGPYRAVVEGSPADVT